MRSTRAHRAGVVAAVALAATALGISASAAVVFPQPVAPHQTFIGEVNGTAVNAVIQVVCPGPVTPGETGHPVSGQGVEATVPVTVPAGARPGYTGESANHIVVDFGTPVSTSAATVLAYYDVTLAIPTSLELPCSGTGEVAFIPTPTSPTARTGYVAVTYENIAV
jgi:hypothetical protein